MTIGWIGSGSKRVIPKGYIHIWGERKRIVEFAV
jgi:hypothetical protein